ncbi:transposase [Streptomyces pilosus]|uniref:transposase n=1 Tax=Streptomyces pilosus TaxID=28893 RepID=UPI00363466EE
MGSRSKASAAHSRASSLQRTGSASHSDLTAFAAFPHQLWKKIQSTHPLKRLNREIERGTDVALVCPTTTPVARTTCLGTPPVVRSACPGLLLRSPPMATGDRCGGACPAPRMTG